MLVEAGKRYVMRNGDVSNEMIPTESNGLYTFQDSKNGATYRDNGRYTQLLEEHPCDLIEEYVEQHATEPQEQQRSAWIVPSGTDKHEIRIGSLFILQKGRTQFEEGGIIVSIVDDAAGEYVTIGNPESKHPVGFDPSEWPVVREAIDFMVAHCRTDEEMK